MKRTRRLMSVLLAAIMTLTLLSTTAFAAVKSSPYGFIVLDQEEQIWHFQTYEYNSGERAYEIEDYAFLRGNNLLDRKGKLIYNDVMEMDTDFDLDYTDIQEQADQPTVAFDDEYFYFITEDGEVARMDESTDSTYEVAKSITNAKYFVLDNDDFVTKVVYSSNSSKNISSLSFSGSHKRSTSSSSSRDDELPDEYVFTYMYDGDPEKIGYDAYYDGEVLISIYCKDNNIWVESENFLLSESSVGAKFVGYSEGYQVVRYDNNGKIGLTPYDKWSKTYWISLNYEVKSFEKDENGFIEYIVTSGTKYNLQDLIEQYNYDNYDFDGDDNRYDDDDDRYDDDDEADIYDNISYVSRSSSKAVAYKSNNKALATIQKSSNYLYYEDLKLKNSYGAYYFSFTEDDGYPVWINSEYELWYFDGNDEELLEEDVSSITYDSNGFAYKYTVSSRSYNFDFDDIDDDDDDYDVDVYDNISYVERSSSKAVAYKSNDKELATIKKSNNYLYYEDIKLKNSYKPSYFSFTEDEGYVVWINDDDELWYFDGNDEELLEEDVTSITYDSDGFAYKYKVGNKNYSFDF